MEHRREVIQMTFSHQSKSWPTGFTNAVQDERCGPQRRKDHLERYLEGKTLLAAENAPTVVTNDVQDEQWEQQLDFSPESRTYLGSKKNYDLLDDYTPEGAEDQLAWLRNSVDLMEQDFSFEELTEDGKLSWEMWKYSLVKGLCSNLAFLNGFRLGRK